MSFALKIGFFKPFALSLSKGDGHGPFMVRSWFDKLTTNGKILSLLEILFSFFVVNILMFMTDYLEGRQNKKCGGHFCSVLHPEFLQF